MRGPIWIAPESSAGNVIWLPGTALFLQLTKVHSHPTSTLLVQIYLVFTGFAGPPEIYIASILGSLVNI